MAVASLVLGIISLVIGLIPFVGTIAFIPALLGLVFGIIELTKDHSKDEPADDEKQKSKKGKSIAGVILSGIAIVSIIFWNVILIKLAGWFTVFVQDKIEDRFGKEVEQITEEDIGELVDEISGYIKEKAKYFAD